jgi:hypothetical protein
MGGKNVVQRTSTNVFNPRVQPFTSPGIYGHQARKLPVSRTDVDAVTPKIILRYPKNGETRAFHEKVVRIISLKSVND